MNVKGIIEWSLVDGGYVGLYDPVDECSCNLDDLAPCTGNEGSDNFHRCMPRSKADAEAGAGD